MILVLGGNGFLGKNVIAALENANLYYLSPSRSQLDLLDFNSVDTFSIENFTGIINLAAIVGGIQFNIDKNSSILENNIQIGLAVNQLARKAHNLEWIIQVGSTCMYPEKASLPYRVSDIWNGLPISATGQYGIAKRVQLMLTEALPSHIKRLNIIPVNLYGKHDRYKGDHSHVIPALIQRIHYAKVNKHNEVIIWGHPDVTREFLFVGDLSDFFIQWIDRPKSCTLNAGTGVETTMSYLSKLIAKTIGFEGLIKFDSNKPIGNLRRLVDSGAYRKLYASTPVSLEEGVKLTYLDFLANNA